MKKKKGELRKENGIWKLIFGSSIIMLFILLSTMPAIHGAPPGNVDSGNYVAPKHYTKIAYYNFNKIYVYQINNNQNYSYVWDDSGRDKKGILNNLTSTNEKDNNINGNAALLFDEDVRAYVQVNHSADFNVSGSFSMSSLIKTSSESDTLIICSKVDDQNGFSFFLNSGKLACTVWNNGNSTTIYDSDGSDLRDGYWHFVAFELFRGTAKLYIDPSPGSYGEVESTSIPYYPGNNTNPFYIGKKGSDYFDGAMDFLYFYALPFTDLNPPYIHRMWGKENVGYWPMDEGNLNETMNFVNDMARSDFNSYGQVSNIDNVAYASSNSFGNAAPGTHALQFYSTNEMSDHGSVVINDNNNYLDFDCDSEEDDLYIEFWINPEDTKYNQILIQKWDWIGNNQANGYRIYLDYSPLFDKYELKFEVANSTITTLTSKHNVAPGYWYHIWAWSIGGNMYTHVEGGLSANTTDNTTNTNGIGQTGNPLIFAFGFPLWYATLTPDWPFVGIMDDVVIGRCYPR